MEKICPYRVTEGGSDVVLGIDFDLDFEFDLALNFEFDVDLH